MSLIDVVGVWGVLVYGAGAYTPYNTSTRQDATTVTCRVYKRSVIHRLPAFSLAYHLDNLKLGGGWGLWGILMFFGVWRWRLYTLQHFNTTRRTNRNL